MVRAATVRLPRRPKASTTARAVELARRQRRRAFSVAARAGHARALYFAGDLDEAWTTVNDALEHPDAERRPPEPRGRPLDARARRRRAAAPAQSARSHAEKAKAIVGGIGTSRSWLGANAAAALGAVLEGEGTRRGRAGAHLRGALLQRRGRDRPPRVAARPSPGPRSAADASTRPKRRCSAREALDELADAGAFPLWPTRSRSSSRGEARADSGNLEAPSEAELAVLGCWPPICRSREIGGSCSSRPTRFDAHARSTASSASRPEPRRLPERASWARWAKRITWVIVVLCGLVRTACLMLRDADSAVPADRRGRAERPRRGDPRGDDFDPEGGKTVLVGDVRDQAELQGLLQRLADFGLTLLSATAVDEAAPRSGGA